jgi:hypothetical protein
MGRVLQEYCGRAAFAPWIFDMLSNTELGER